MEESNRGTRILLSKLCGINCKSPLFYIEGVKLDVAVHDPMHVLLEGIILVELKEMLFNFICVEKYFSLQWFNDQLSSWNYIKGSNKPPPFVMENFKESKITLSASVILVLLNILPFILSKKVPYENEKLLNFIRLVKITHISTSPYALQETEVKLKELISKHHEIFRIQYPHVSLKPKFHYLIHFPNQMKKFGPLRHHWCMRWEGHFSVFKGKKWGSYKNIAFSMAYYHQLWMCFNQLGPMGERSLNYLYKGHKIIIQSKLNLLDFDEAMQEQIMSHFGSLEMLFIASEVKFHGCLYKPGFVLSDESEKIFFFITSLIVRNSNILLILKPSSKATYKLDNSFQIYC